MTTYEVYNDDGLLARVSDQQLAEAAAGDGPLTAQLANAAAAAGCVALVVRLRATLDATERPRKLAAAKALLALGDTAAIGLLEQRATSEVDTIAAKVFTAVALRMRGPDHAAAYFRAADSDPQTCRLLLSNYNSYLELERGDVRFLVFAVRAYMDKRLPWLRKLRVDLWENGLYLALQALGGASALDLEALGPERGELTALLDGIAELRVDRDIREEAAALRRRLTA